MVLATLEGLWERLRLVLGRLEGILDRLGGILGRLGGILEASWIRLGRFTRVHPCAPVCTRVPDGGSAECSY